MPDLNYGATLAEVYSHAALRYDGLPGFCRKDKTGKFVSRSFRETYEQGLDLATSLIALGLEAREHVGILADNRLEWILADYAILLAGAADVPRGTDTTDAELIYILTHSDARFVFVENQAMLARVQRCRPQLPHLHSIIVMAPGDFRMQKGVHGLDQLMRDGGSRRSQGDSSAVERARAVRPDDLCTIIYTSGTTGTPKGVQLTHANMCSQIANLPLALRPGDRALSILPVWHSYERAFEMLCISRGVGTYYTSLRSLAEDLKIVRPTVMASAPRLWENLYLKILSNVKSTTPVRQRLFHLAYQTTRHVKRAERFFRGQQLDEHGRGFLENLSLAASHAILWAISIIPAKLLDALVLKKLRAIVGGEFRGTISGGGALQPHVDEFFNFIGIPVLEGYGMTETSPVLAVRTWDNLVIGTVGEPYPKTEVRIVDLQNGDILYPDSRRRGGGRGLRGEIHVKGPQVMRGYYKDPEGTSRVLRDGWMNTGDIGMVTYNGCLKILGRSKDTIVLLNGENIEPVPIEARLVESPFVDQCMVLGQDQKALAALLVPSFEHFRLAGITASSAGELWANPQARHLVDESIRNLINHSNGFKSYERIAAWRFLPKAFEVGDEMTNTFKLKRHVITDRYASLILELFPGQAG
ncbi:MAG: long-chain fatty acid--CoA ligase [bacterium]